MERDSERGKFLIYIVEDDDDIRELEYVSLSHRGYAVLGFANGELFQKAFSERKPDLAIIDLMLPGIQGEELIRQIRAESANDSVQLVIVSAKNMLADRIGGLDIGADDYIEKPFDIFEFLARINARYRRTRKPSRLTFEMLMLDDSTHTAAAKGRNLNLTDAEFAILRELMRKDGNVVARQELVAALWGKSTPLETRTIDMHINAIRKKIGAANAWVLQTVYGVGYRLARKPDAFAK